MTDDKTRALVERLRDFKETLADHYAAADTIEAQAAANRAMLAALKSFADNFGGDAGLDAAMRIGLDAELIEARSAIAAAEAAGIKEG